MPDYAAAMTGEVKGLKLGLPVEYLKHLSGEPAAALLVAGLGLAFAPGIADHAVQQSQR